MLEDVDVVPTAGDSCPKNEQAPANPYISIESASTEVFMPHIIFHEAAMEPTKLQQSVETDVLDNVVPNKSEFDDSHDQILRADY